ncbi:uncharacterized protein LOC133893273 [Phragmites australis]|uniref:uncharacterized protein LOC133893273 n=1 Tax=Phragmites australis TaxID=29695 RepID=UPI002D788CC0|nr:uncharacterized protein LOC133893273 [Phragmites australis]
MTTKEYILIIEVDLECEKCYKKIQKVLCKLQPKENIRKIDYYDKKNIIAITGPFDPEKLSRKLRCKACEVIKDIKVYKPHEEKKPEAKKPDEEKKPEEKKPEEKKSDEKKSDEKKTDDKKPADDKKSGDKKPAEDKKSDEKEKPKDDAKATAAAAVPSSSATTVNLQFTNMCVICYPWPCSDPGHLGVHPQHPPQPQWPCEGMAPPQLPAPGHHQHPQPPWGAAPKWAPCGGPSYCGGCRSCHGGAGGMYGWAPPAPQPMCCPGPSACRGCNGCRMVRESKFSYEEYPPSACAIM